ncbi:hypothetical protein VCR1J2_610020 [Vibrio coralliirubri]|nr:hypothetical protein VCR1J2_610020 [Vibrio coralliirubri]CDU03366.1 hypothetical protein VCR8J2_860022 [Vibrio coralliirubri]
MNLANYGDGLLLRSKSRIARGTDEATCGKGGNNTEDNDNDDQLYQSKAFGYGAVIHNEPLTAKRILIIQDNECSDLMYMNSFDIYVS